MKTLSLPVILALGAATLSLGACSAQQGGAGRTAGGATEAPAGETGAGHAEVPPQLLAEVVDDLVARTDAKRSQVEVLRAEAVTWRNSSLGCPEPGMMYSQVLTEGYWIVLGHAGREHDYRARRGGSFLLCEQPDRVGPLE